MTATVLAFLLSLTTGPVVVTYIDTDGDPGHDCAVVRTTTGPTLYVFEVPLSALPSGAREDQTVRLWCASDCTLPTDKSFAAIEASIRADLDAVDLRWRKQ